jgi:MerR family copper efflux transcriptional regulator
MICHHAQAQPQECAKSPSVVLIWRVMQVAAPRIAGDPPLGPQINRRAAGPDPRVARCSTRRPRSEHPSNLDTTVVGFNCVQSLTINEAATTTGWSPRMLRYVEQAGLVAPARSASGYRLYGAAELQRLRTLKELLAQFDISLSDVAFAQRMAGDVDLRAAVEGWLYSQAERPQDVQAEDWLRFEQEKHERLIAAVA